MLDNILKELYTTTKTFKTYPFHPIFQSGCATIQSMEGYLDLLRKLTDLAIIFKICFQPNGVEFQTTKRGFCQAQTKEQKPPSFSTYASYTKRFKCIFKAYFSDYAIYGFRHDFGEQILRSWEEFEETKRGFSQKQVHLQKPI